MARDDYDVTLEQISKIRFSMAKIETVLRIYSLIGVLLTIFSIGFLAYTFLPVELTREQQLALFSAGLGISLALMSIAYLYIRKERMKQELTAQENVEHLYKFLRTWANFEATSKAVLNKRHTNTETYNPRSLRSVILGLYEEGKIDQSDVLMLEEALEARNEIVHGRKPLSSHLADRFSNFLVELINKLA